MTAEHHPGIALAVAALAVFALDGPREAAPQTADVPSAARPGAERALWRSGIDLVALQVTVEDPKGRSVPGLSVDDFAVFEDGVRQEVATFATASAPLDLMLLVDTSGSMNQRTPATRDAMVELFRGLRPGDRGALIVFNDDVRMPQPLTHDISALEQTVPRAAAVGGTALYDAVDVALRELVRSRVAESHIRRQALVLISDGEDTASTRMPLVEVLAIARRSGVTLFTIMPRMVDPTGLQRMVRRAQIAEAEFTMQSLAQVTGGRAFLAIRSEDLARTYRQITDELSCQYWLGYEPAALATGYRRVEVMLVRHPRLRARTRRGYDATASLEVPPESTRPDRVP